MRIKIPKRQAIGLTAVAIAAVTILAVSTATNWNTAAAQSSVKSVSNLQATSNAQDDIVITWDAPTSAPKDYRVMWAKPEDGYKTWSDLSGNAFPTTTTHTVTDPDAEQEYMIKVRARYSSGSGPWSAELRYTTPAAGDNQPPPPPPTPTATPMPPTPEPGPSAPHWESSTMPETVAMFDWSDVDDATGYELEQNVPVNGNHNWVDITQPGEYTQAYVNGSAAIIGQPYAGPVHLRVRATFDDGTATDWYLYSVNTTSQ